MPSSPHSAETWEAAAEIAEFVAVRAESQSRQYRAMQQPVEAAGEARVAEAMRALVEIYRGRVDREDTAPNAAKAPWWRRWLR